MSDTKSLAKKLEAVMAGSQSLQSVIADQENFKGSAYAALDGLQHYLADADIRAKDCDYRTMQEREMKKLIRLLNLGADASALSKITFLGVSGE